ncbi:hypothetical protein COEREDRAFT_90094 [Coemansia reversa NRRL 1564]|uniref:Conserved oligomeric Golgi complex subunit 5 n=1 Tax=Coemansia reversa (strain ATCC 12441 / NRRL 1564) TaxID=763665 RepID=A0A2G5B157_COERN|nr:hypothetical protein COEREDRAFT_90094 [Coemansia reversa NRRL 1564]|eukprot:PIA12740.1 hypothetical protein COEREDRAFT_90094 [Coemansia reversa NRRL 1564]
MSGLLPHSSTASEEVYTPETQYRHFEDAFSDFLGPNFEPLQYAQSLASEENGHDDSDKADRITQLMALLASKAENLDGLMRHTIITSHEDLLKQIVGVKAVDSSLGQIEEQVREIKLYMHGLRTKICVPYEQVLRYTNQSSNLQLAIAHVRATTKFMQLVQRLRVQIPDTAVVVEPSESMRSTTTRPDYALAALTLLDIEKLVNGNDLTGVHVVDRAMEQTVNQRRVQTIAEAESMIDAGMQRQHQSDIASGLQIMFNLGVLPICVANRVRKRTVGWADYVSGMLDPKSINTCVRDHNKKATAVDGSDMVSIDSILWKRLETIVDELLTRGLELRVLERVLARKRDALPRFEVSVGVLDGPRSDGAIAGPGTTFLDFVVGQLGDRVLAFWWGTAVNALAAEVNAACTESSVVKQILTNSYPRLVQLFLPKLEPILASKFGGVVSIGTGVGDSESLHGANAGLAPSPHLVSGSSLQQSPNISYNDPGPHVLWEKLLNRFESEYVAKAESRIEDAVRRCYPPPPPPGLLDAQESWGHRGVYGRSGSPTVSAGEQRSDMSADMERMPVSNVVPNRKLVASVVRSISTELEMAKSDARLCGAVAKAAHAAIELFVSITEGKLSSITVNSSVLDPLAEPVNPLTRSYAGLVNAVESLRVGLGELCEQEYAVVEGPLAWSARRRLSAMARRTSRQSSAHSSRAGSIAAVVGDGRVASSSPGPVEEAGSVSATVRQMLNRCLYALSAFVNKQTDALLSIADAAIMDAIKEYVVDVESDENTTNYQNDDSVAGWTRIDRAMQWLQTQILELLDVDCQKRVCTMVDRYLFLYFRVVCLTFPLTEGTRLRLTGEVTQFEFASSQLVGQASGSARERKKLALPSLGRSYQVLRLVRPLLFMSAKDLTQMVASRSSISANAESSAEWCQVPLLDFVDHIVCRVATDIYAPDSVAKARRHMPYFLLGCTRREWIDCVSAACEDQGSAVKNIKRDICMNPTMQSVWNKGQDICESCRGVLLETLKRLAKNTQLSSDMQELVELLQAATDAVSVSKI